MRRGKEEEEGNKLRERLIAVESDLKQVQIEANWERKSLETKTQKLEEQLEVYRNVEGM